MRHDIANIRTLRGLKEGELYLIIYSAVGYEIGRRTSYGGIILYTIDGRHHGNEKSYGTLELTVDLLSSHLCNQEHITNIVGEEALFLANLSGDWEQVSNTINDNIVIGLDSYRYLRKVPWYVVFGMKIKKAFGNIRNTL